MTKPGPGKFEGCASLEVAEFLYSILNVSGFSEQFGSVSENGLCESLIILENEDPRPPINDSSDEHIDFVAYVVTENEAGFFDYTGYKDKDEAMSAYLADLAAYESYATR